MYGAESDCFSKARQAEKAPAAEADAGTMPWNASVPRDLLGR